MFNNKQLGFIKSQLTILQLLNVMDIWTESLESGAQIEVIYTDLEKTFERFPHKRLISKSYSYKINIDVIKWIESFLLNRRQRVCVNGFFSYIGDKYLAEYQKAPF